MVLRCSRGAEAEAHAATILALTPGTGEADLADRSPYSPAVLRSDPGSARRGLRGTRHVAVATPRRPETSYARARRVQRSVTLLVLTEPDAEPDPGRFEVPRR